MSEPRDVSEPLHSPCTRASAATRVLDPVRSRPDCRNVGWHGVWPTDRGMEKPPGPEAGTTESFRYMPRSHLEDAHAPMVRFIAQRIVCIPTPGKCQTGSTATPLCERWQYYMADPRQPSKAVAAQEPVRKAVCSSWPCGGLGFAPRHTPSCVVLQSCGQSMATLELSFDHTSL